jgi:hypothetical protein
MEKDWKSEYRDYVIDVVKTFENKFDFFIFLKKL